MMAFHIIFSIIVFWIFYKFTRNVEILDCGEWKSFTLPLWLWVLVTIAAFIPLFNIIGLIVFIITCMVDAKGIYPDTRFTKGNVIFNFINKIANLLTKEF